jgi:hypothetical protein
MKLKPAQIIHICFCIAIVMFATVTLLINKDALFFDASLTNTSPFNPVFPIISILGIVAGIFMFKKKIGAITPEQSFDEKFMQYQTAFLIKCAFCEAGALLNLVGCFQTHNLFFMLFAAASFIALLLSRPTKDKVIEDLQLQYPDTESL